VDFVESIVDFWGYRAKSRVGLWRREVWYSDQNGVFGASTYFLSLSWCAVALYFTT